MIDHLVHTDFKPVDKREGLGSALGYINGDTSAVPIVMDEGYPFGVLNERGLMRTNLNPAEHIDNYTVSTGTIPVRATLREVMKFFANTPVDYAPVQSEGQLVGYVSAVDVLGEVKDGPDARGLMDEVPILKNADTIGHAFHALREVRASHVPVVDESGRVIGALGRQTLTKMGINRSLQGRRMHAGGEMVHLVDMHVRGFTDVGYRTVRPDASFKEVVEKLKEGGYAIVTTEEGKPLGVITAPRAIVAMSKRWGSEGRRG